MRASNTVHSFQTNEKNLFTNGNTLHFWPINDKLVYDLDLFAINVTFDRFHKLYHNVRFPTGGRNQYIPVGQDSAV